ncbi:hypothetical protein MRX96_041290, partial [Rhipicephalus microplus]
LDVYYKAANEQTQLDGVQPTGDSAARDTYHQALAVLDACLRRLKTLSASVSSSDAKCRNRTKLLFIQFIQELIRLAGTCGFGAAATTNIQDQTLQGLRDPNLVHSFIRMEDAFTVQKALEHAKKEECVARAMQ